METFEIPLYTGHLTVCIYTDLKKSIEQCGFTYNNEADHYSTLTLATTGRQYFVFLPPDVTPGSLASSARRLCKLIFQFEKIKISLEQTEHECRLIEWLVDQIYIVLNDTKIKEVYAAN